MFSLYLLVMNLLGGGNPPPEADGRNILEVLLALDWWEWRIREESKIAEA